MITNYWEDRFTDLLKRLNKHYKLNVDIDNIEKKNIVIEAIKQQDTDVYKMLSEYNIVFDSYSFIRSDKDLMLKAKDIWEAERKNFRNALEKIDGDFDRLLEEKKVK